MEADSLLGCHSPKRKSHDILAVFFSRDIKPLALNSHKSGRLRELN